MPYSGKVPFASATRGASSNLGKEEHFVRCVCVCVLIYIYYFPVIRSMSFNAYEGFAWFLLTCRRPLLGLFASNIFFYLFYLGKIFLSVFLLTGLLPRVLSLAFHFKYPSLLLFLYQASLFPRGPLHSKVFFHHIYTGASGI